MKGIGILVKREWKCTFFIVSLFSSASILDGNASPQFGITLNFNFGIRQKRWNKSRRGQIRSMLWSVPEQFGTEITA